VDLSAGNCHLDWIKGRGRAGEGPGKGRGTEGDRARYLEYGVWDIAWRVRQ
jgi:hypothetical protein